jgi:hypothetical protein
MQFGYWYVLVDEGTSALTQTLVVDPADVCVHVCAHVVVSIHGQDHDGQYPQGGGGGHLRVQP